MERRHLPSAPANPPKSERRGRLGLNKPTGEESNTLPLPDADTGKTGWDAISRMDEEMDLNRAE